MNHDECIKVKNQLDKDLADFKSLNLSLQKKFIEADAKYQHAFEAGQNAAKKADEIIKKIDGWFQQSLTLNQKLLELLPDDLKEKLMKEYKDMLAGNILK